MTTHKYLKIKQYILDNIHSGDYLIGEKIESENTLMNRFQVSRMTVRQAIGELQKEGILKTIKGKGTYVQESEIGSNGAFLMSFTEKALFNNLVPSSQIISFKKILSTEYMNSVFSFEQSEEIYQIIRVRYINTLPAAYEESLIPCRLIGEIDESDLNGSLFNYLDTCDHSITHANQKTIAILPDSDIQTVLGINEVPILKVIQRCYDQNNQCIELGYTYYHPENYINTRTVMRRKVDVNKVDSMKSILLISDKGIVTSSIEEKILSYIKDNQLNFSLTVIDFRVIYDFIEKYDFILIEPRYQYALDELTLQYPLVNISIIPMDVYGQQDVQSIINTLL